MVSVVRINVTCCRETTGETFDLVLIAFRPLTEQTVNCRPFWFHYNKLGDTV